MGLEAGKLRHRVTIEQQITIINDLGEQETAWVEFARRWAAVEPLSGRERFLAEQAQSEVVTRITIRYLAGVTASMRALHRGKIYDIKSVREDRESGIEYLTLDCATGINEG